MESKKEMTQTNLQNRKRLTDLENKLMVVGGKDSLGVWDGHVHTAIFKIDNQQGPDVKNNNNNNKRLREAYSLCLQGQAF